MEAQKSKSPSGERQQSELRFILVSGLAKTGTFFGVGWFLIHYFSKYGFSLPDSGSGDFWYLAYESLISGAFFGLGMGLFGWHQFKKNSE